MPVVAVGAAMYAGAGIAAAGGLTAFAATYGTWAAIGAVGAITAGVGTVTGNKDLTRIGTVAAIAGGVGALAQNSGWFTSSEIASSGAAETAQAGAATSAAEGGSISTSLGETSAGVANPAADLATTGTTTGATTGSTGAGGLMAQPAAETLTPIAATDVGSYGGVANVTAEAPVSGAGGVLETIKSLGGFMEDNKMLSEIGSNFIGGMFDDKKGAETDLLKTRAETERSMLKLQQQQAANANAVPDITNLRVNPAADVYAGMQSKTYKPVRVGLINS